MTAIARETFHYADGVVYAGDRFVDEAPVVQAFRVLFDVVEDEVKSETPRPPLPPQRRRTT